jgi:hypothetical protein
VNNGNGWGSHGARITRASDGALYTTYLTANPDPNLVDWTLASRPSAGGQWHAVTGGMTEKNNPPQVLSGPGGTVYVISLSTGTSTLKGAPEIWNSTSRLTEPIPGHWLSDSTCAHGQFHCLEQSSALYIAAGIDSAGDITFMEDVPCSTVTSSDGSAPKCVSADVPGTYDWAYRRATDGQWAFHRWVTPYRQAYNFLLPRPSAMTVVGTRDILSHEAGVRCASYCFDQVRWANWPRLTSTPTPLVVRAASGSPYLASAEDAYRDTRGNTHILYSLHDGSDGGTYTNRHMIVSPRGAILKDVTSPVPYVNLSRILQDASGRFWIYSVGPGVNNRCTIRIAGGTRVDHDGTSFSPVTELRMRQDCREIERNFDAAPRLGAAMTNTIDGVFAANLGKTWVHYRIKLPPLARIKTPAPLSRVNTKAEPKVPQRPTSTGAGYSSGVLADHPLAYWPLNESGGTQAEDGTGKGHAATYVGKVAFGLRGPLRSSRVTAVQLGGQGAYIDAGHANQFALRSGTLELWFRTAEASAGLVVRPEAFGLFVHNGLLSLFDWGGGGWRDSKATVDGGKWHQAAETFRSGVTGGTTLYLDGRAVSRTTMRVLNQQEDLVMGAQNAAGWFLSGTIGQVAIYPYVLSATRLRAHYARATGN